MSQKTQKIKIAFDLDGVIIDTPPLVPKSLIEWFFRGTTKEVLHYRFPKSKIEQLIRKISHFYFFRPPINKNIEFLKELAKNRSYKLYIISARYSFLKKETESWLKKRKISRIFDHVYLNLADRQPHLFKENILKTLRPQIYVDDDDLLLKYLTPKLKGIQIYYLFPHSPNKQKMSPEVRVISSLRKINL